MGQIFGHRWTGQEGEPKDSKGNFTGRFLLWVEKTEKLTDDDWRRGFENVEIMVREKTRNHETAYPPSYAEFLGMCDNDENQKYIPEHKMFALTKIESDEERAERKQSGLEKSQRLKSIFD